MDWSALIRFMGRHIRCCQVLVSHHQILPHLEDEKQSEALRRGLEMSTVYEYIERLNTLSQMRAFV
jgi:hypothetical protein